MNIKKYLIIITFFAILASCAILIIFNNSDITVSILKLILVLIITSAITFKGYLTFHSKYKNQYGEKTAIKIIVMNKIYLDVFIASLSLLLLLDLNRDERVKILWILFIPFAVIKLSIWVYKESRQHINNNDVI